MRENHRTATIFAGVYGLLQGVCWSIFAIYCCAIYGCTVPYPFPLSDSRLTSSDLLYLSYFKGSCRAPAGTLAYEAPSASRTYYWMLIYGVLSAVWIPASVLLIVAAVNKVKGQYGTCLYLPWIIITCFILLADLIATIAYSMDISHTMTVSEYIEFVHIPKGAEEFIKGADGITVIPAIIMVVIFSKAAIFWLINFVLLGVVVQASRSLRQNSPSRFIQEGLREDRPDASNRWVNVSKDDVNLGIIPRPTSSPLRLRSSENPISPQSPLSALPPTPPQKPSFLRQRSSPLFDVNGKHAGEFFPPEPPGHKNGDPNDVNNQLPWSYVGPQGRLLKRQDAASVKGVTKPTIPVPDYTMRLPNLSRSESTNSYQQKYGDQRRHINY